MSESRACLRDTDALVEFQKKLAFISGSVERALDAVSDYVNDVHAEFERHIAVLEEAVRLAKGDVEAAKADKDTAELNLQRARDEKETASEELQEAIREEEMEEMYEDDEDDYDDYDDYDD